MDVLSMAQKLLDRIRNQIEKTETIEQRNGEEAMPDLNDLLCDLVKNKEIAQQMIEEINEAMELNPEKRSELVEKIGKLEDKIGILEENHQRRVALLERELFEKDQQMTNLIEQVQGHKNKQAATQNVLESLQKQLKEFESSLQTGQIAFDFEKDLAIYIYPQGMKIGSRKTFKNMKKWLEEKKDTQHGREANKKWNELQKEFSWSDEHEKVFLKLIESRKEFAHPQVDLDTVQSQIPDGFTDQEKECIKDIIGMIERVNILMP